MLDETTNMGGKQGVNNLNSKYLTVMKKKPTAATGTVIVPFVPVGQLPLPAPGSPQGPISSQRVRKVAMGVAEPKQEAGDASSRRYQSATNASICLTEEAPIHVSAMNPVNLADKDWTDPYVLKKLLRLQRQALGKADQVFNKFCDCNHVGKCPQLAAFDMLLDDINDAARDKQLKKMQSARSSAMHNKSVHKPLRSPSAMQPQDAPINRTTMKTVQQFRKSSHLESVAKSRFAHKFSIATYDLPVDLRRSPPLAPRGPSPNLDDTRLQAFTHSQIDATEL